MAKKRILVFILILTLITLTGCGKSNVADKKGNMLAYEYEDLANGFYVLNSDGTFNPVMNGASGYDGFTLEGSKERYLWFTENVYSLSELIPVVNSNSRLVAYFNEGRVMPKDYTLERYKYRGRTIGAKVFTSEDGKSLYMSNSSENLCPTSAMETVFDGLEISEEITISSFNGKTSLPLKSVDNNINALLGLEKDATYQIGFYTGTIYRSVTVPADTLIFQSKELILLDKPFKKTEKGFFVVDIPTTCKAGYYYINDYGLFKYEP